MLENLYEKFLASTGVCTDTRKINQGNIFFALKGENFNGNQFALKALEEGCAYAIVDEEAGADDRLIQVENVLSTLQKLARHHRDQLSIPVVGLTGSNGKTTTKELIATVLKRKFNTYATKGNLNNHIGVPLSILEIGAEHEIAVIEMGANALKEIGELCDICDPSHGLITNIGKAHLEGFGSLEGIRKTKGELYDHLKARAGRIFYNADDATLTEMIGDYAEAHSYGQENAQTEARFLESNPEVVFFWGKEVHTQLIGQYNFYNMLSAIAVGVEFDVDQREIQNALAEYVSENNRSQVVEGRNTIILDAYNANPTSMRAALENFAAMSGDKMCILGDMLELGEDSDTEHRNIMSLAKELDLPTLLVGDIFKSLADPAEFQAFHSREELEHLFYKNTPSGKVILIKGSRGIKLEPLAEILA